MTNVIMILALIVTMIVPSLLHFGFKMSGKKLKYAVVINTLSFMFICASSAIIVLNGGTVGAEETTAVVNSSAGMGYIAAALATGLATIGAGIAVAASATAAIGAISEDQTLTGKALIFVALAEGIALYGVIVSFVIVNKL